MSQVDEPQTRTDREGDEGAADDADEAGDMFDAEESVRFVTSEELKSVKKEL